MLTKEPTMVSSVELRNIEASGPSDEIALSPTADLCEVPEGHQEFSLPPADGGKQAWLFLTASFFLEGLVWGFPYSFGVFQDHYQTHEPFAGSSGIATIGTCTMGIMYFTFPLVIALLRFFPRAFRWAPAIGLFIMSLSLIFSSLAQTVPHLILTQGIMYGIAGSFSYCPCMIWVEQWFVQRRGLAFGIMWSGTGIGGFAIPLVLQSLLDAYGFRTTLRVWAIALFLLAIPIIYLIKPRMPAHQQTIGRTSLRSLKFVYNRTFLMYQIASIVESFGYFLPGIYLPTFARMTLNAKPFPAALTVILINVATAAGTMAIGHLTDKWDVTTCILISTVGAVLGTFFLWGFATNLATLYAFCIIYGLFAGSYVGTWPGITRQVTSSNVSKGSGHTFDPIMVLAFMTAGRGIGNIISGPLSEALLKASPIGARGSRTWGGEYGAVIIFTGSTALLGGASYLWKRLGWLR